MKKIILIAALGIMCLFQNRVQGFGPLNQVDKQDMDIFFEHVKNIGNDFLKADEAYDAKMKELQIKADMMKAKYRGAEKNGTWKNDAAKKAWLSVMFELGIVSSSYERRFGKPVKDK